MTSGFFATVFSEPLYNGLIFLMSIIPGHDAGIAVVIFTIAVRLVLYPLSRRSIETQLKLKGAQVDIDRIKATVTDKTQQALADLFVIHRVINVIAVCGLADITGHFQINHHGLLDLALPIPDADDAFGAQGSQKNLVSHLVSHGVHQNLVELA